jgi:hypothetical protein
LDEVLPKHLDELLHLKLAGCCEVFSFDKEPTKEYKQRRSAKRTTLIELVEYVTRDDVARLRFFSPTPVEKNEGEDDEREVGEGETLRGGHLQAFVDMVQSNLFCPLRSTAEGDRGGNVVEQHLTSFPGSNKDAAMGVEKDEAVMGTSVKQRRSSPSISQSPGTSTRHHKRKSSSSSSASTSSSSSPSSGGCSSSIGGGGEIHNAAWAHVQVVYEFFVRFVFDDRIPATECRSMIGRTFLSGMIDQFRSADSRERNYVKTIVHQCYVRFNTLRTFLRSTMSHMLSDYHQGFVQYYDGISNMLEIFASIIAGFKSPLRKVHLSLLQRVLMPLHRRSGTFSFESFETYYTPLLECVISFVQRDISTLEMVVQGLLSAWSRRPHVLLLEELEIMINLSPPAVFKKIVPNVLLLLSQAVVDQHFHIAERALLLWRGEYFVSLIAQHRRDAMPSLYKPLVDSETNHWHPQVRVLASNVLQLFQSMDESLFRELETSVD